MQEVLSEIAFRVDASALMGSGHVMRCLTLADALAARGSRCHFISRAHPGHLLDLIRQRGHAVSALAPGQMPEADDTSPYASWLGTSWQQDAEQTLISLGRHRPDWLVVDHYALDAQWESALAPHCGRLATVDDLADRAHRCDLLLDQNLGRAPSDYADKVPTACTVLAGPMHALLRPVFAALRAVSLARRHQGRLRHILITMGGGDPRDATRRCLLAVRDSIRSHPAFSADLRITVIMGPQATSLDVVREMARQMPCPTEVLFNVANLAELMVDSDLAIGAAGSTSWERCCLGLPTLMLVLADNQREAARQLALAGAAWLVETSDELDSQLQQALKTLATEPHALADMAMRAAAVTDGMGASRVLTHMHTL